MFSHWKTDPNYVRDANDAGVCVKCDIPGHLQDLLWASELFLVWEKTSHPKENHLPKPRQNLVHYCFYFCVHPKQVNAKSSSILLAAQIVSNSQAGIWKCEQERQCQGQLHGQARSIGTQSPTLRSILQLVKNSAVATSNSQNFIFDLAFCKWSSMGQWNGEDTCEHVLCTLSTYT